jgi:predicted enzyme related to lactoylglutathione lyase
MTNPVTHFEVVGSNAQALQHFYSEAFGWQMKAAGPTYAMALPGDERGINGGVGEPPEGGAPRVTFYIEVPDLEATLEFIER